MRLIPEKVVLERYLGGAVNRTTLFRWRRAGLFPEPLKFSAGRSFYLEAEVVAAIERKVVERDARARAIAEARGGAQAAGAGR